LAAASIGLYGGKKGELDFRFGLAELLTVASLARPGGNVTGLSDVATALSTKRLSLLKELLPQLRRVAMLWNKGDRGMSLRYEASAVAARELGVIVQPLGVSEPDDFIEAFDTMNRERPDAILMVSDSLTLLNRRRVFEYAAERRLPAIYETDSLTREGGLMSYGPDRREIFERSAGLAPTVHQTFAHDARANRRGFWQSRARARSCRSQPRL